MCAIALQRVNALSLGYVLFRITHDIEKLPFPMAAVQAGGATALAETSSKKEGWRWHVFSTGAFIGAVWGIFYVVVPTLSSVFLTETVSILPIPFIDFTVPMKAVLPAAVVGLATDLIHVLFGLVLPFWVVVGIFASTMVVNLIANPILYASEILHTWEPGMSAIPTHIANTFDFWLSFSLGGAIVVAVIGFYTAGKVLIAASKESRAAEDVSSILAFKGDVANEVLERLREDKVIGQSLDAELEISGNAENDTFAALQRNRDFLPEFFITSAVVLSEISGESETTAVARHASGVRCPMSWRWVPELVSVEPWGEVSPRCSEALREREDLSSS